MSAGWMLGPEHRDYGAPVLPPYPHRRLPLGSWSRYHAACVDCGSTDVPHAAHGRCRRCDHRYRLELDRQAERESWAALS